MIKKLSIGLVVAILLLGGAAFAYRQFSHDTFEANQTLSEEEISSILTSVGKHIRLPNEEPLVATVADIDALVATQLFYQGGKNGDILLMYPTSAKAILYDREHDILVNVGPIILDEEAVAESDIRTTAPVDEQPVDGPVETQ